MPVYGAKNYIDAPQPGDTVVLWNAETPNPSANAASSSIPVAIIAQGRMAIDGKFAADPGAFEIDVMVSEEESPIGTTHAKYQTISGGNMTAVDATNFTFHMDIPSMAGKFLKLLMRSRTNAVAVTASATAKRNI